MKFTNSKFFASIFIVFSAALIIYLGINLKNNKFDIRNKAAGTQVILSIYPSAQNINVNEEKSFDLIANFTNGSPGEKLTYLKVAINFANDYLKIPPGKYIDTGKSGFNKVIRVDGPMVANNTGLINLELAAISASDGPDTSAPLTIAKIYLSAKSVTTNAQFITISKAQVVNAQNSDLPVDLGKATYNVLTASTPNASPTTSSTVNSTPTVSIIASPTPNTTRNSANRYNSNSGLSTALPTVTPRFLSGVPNDSSSQNQKFPANQIQGTSQSDTQAQPANSNLFQYPTPTIFFPDYLSPTPVPSFSIFTGLSNVFRNIICGIFRLC